MANGNESIYLEYYTGDIIRKENYVGGKRQYEFLKLYIVPELTKEDKNRNVETWRLAKAIQSKRIVELQNQIHGFLNPNRSKINVIDRLLIMQKEAETRGTLNYVRTIGNVIRELKLFRGDCIPFAEINKEFLINFVDFLRNAKKSSKYGLVKEGGCLSNSSVSAYYSVLRTIINKAYKEGIIPTNPTLEFKLSDKVKTEKSRREYLTLDEIKLLASTKCKYENIKQAFLFSCLTGFRVSDIRKLTWKDIKKIGDKVRIEIKMHKTKEPLYLPISDSALQWLPSRGNAKDDDVIFTLPHQSNLNDNIQKWVDQAQIRKHVSFHVARHNKLSYSLKTNRLQN